MKKIILSLIVFAVLCSCSDDFLDRQPTNVKDIATLTATADGAQNYMNAVYKFNQSYSPNGVSQHDNIGVMGRMIIDDISGLDVICPANWFTYQYQFVESQRLENHNRAGYNWAWAYMLIKDCNVIITAGAPKEASDSRWKNVLGQAYAMRAWAFYQLCGLYQKHYRVGKDLPGFPLLLDPPTGDAEKDSRPRGKLSDVYNQMVKDLKEATTRLTASRLSKGHINLNTAQGILARVYTDMAYVDPTLWDQVITLTQSAREGFPLMTKVAYKEGFSAPNGEWIWCVIQDKQSNIGYANLFSFYDLKRSFGYFNMRADSSFIASFTATDCRKLFTDLTDTTKSPIVYPANKDRFSITKFKDNTDLTGNIILMRAAEMYLLEAEAKANKDDLSGAQQLVDIIRAARIDGYTSVPAPATRDEMLEVIWKERRKELYGEGFALRDITRFGWFVNGDKALRNSKYHLAGLGIPNGTNNYNTPKPEDNDYRYFNQIPRSEFENNTKLDKSKDQNP